MAATSSAGSGMRPSPVVPQEKILIAPPLVLWLNACMNSQRMKWSEILKHYPDQWVSLISVEKDMNGEVRAAVVTASAPDLKSLTQSLKKSQQPSDRFEFTGAIKNFLGFARWTIEGCDDASSTSK